MIKNDFKIDFEKKIISYIGEEKKVYTTVEFYSFLQDLFDEPESMKYDIPILAESKTNFKMINGWKIDEPSLKHVKGEIK